MAHTAEFKKYWEVVQRLDNILDRLDARKNRLNEIALDVIRQIESATADLAVHCTHRDDNDIPHLNQWSECDYCGTYAPELNPVPQYIRHKIRGRKKKGNKKP